MADDSKKPKPSIEMLIASTKKGKGDDEDDAPASSKRMEDEDYSASVDELADTLDIPDDKREAFTDAFKAAVMACAK